jgi:Antibiotic biosynthesis monooxygenase
MCVGCPTATLIVRPRSLALSPNVDGSNSITICSEPHCAHMHMHTLRVMSTANDAPAFAIRRKEMFIAMNRFRVKRGAEGAFEKVWLSRDSYLDRVPGFWSFICSRGLRPKTIRSVPPMRCGRAKPPSRHGPHRRSSALHTRAPAMMRPGHSIWSIPSSRASKYNRP